jgi:hypothetical protein
MEYSRASVSLSTRTVILITRVSAMRNPELRSKSTAAFTCCSALEIVKLNASSCLSGSTQDITNKNGQYEQNNEKMESAQPSH